MQQMKMLEWSCERSTMERALISSYRCGYHLGLVALYHLLLSFLVVSTSFLFATSLTVSCMCYGVRLLLFLPVFSQKCSTFLCFWSWLLCCRNMQISFFFILNVVKTQALNWKTANHHCTQDKTEQYKKIYLANINVYILSFVCNGNLMSKQR